MDVGMPYKVFVDDNYAAMDESKRYPLGVFDSQEAAVAAAEAIVDEFLFANCRRGMTSEELFAAYRGYGEDPFIVASEPDTALVPLFSARTYASLRCAQVCEELSNEAARPWWKFWAHA